MLHVHMEPAVWLPQEERQDSSHRTEGEALKISSCTRKGHWINLSNSREKESNWEKECRDMDYCKRMKEATSEKWGKLRDKWGEFSKENNHTSLSLEIKMSGCCVKRLNSSMMCFVTCTELQQFHIVKKAIEMFPLARFSQGFLVFNTFLSMVFFHMVRRFPSMMCEGWAGVQVGCNKICRRILSIC